ncbi:glycosyltransferase family 4 protein [Candidatus Sumerlaeota bacterium]|nr:glycosyltransferase family 4 protein [Candidatus Sumerlaeota bacterium]
MRSDQTLTVCSPQIGIDPESNLGGAVYDRHILKELARLGARVVIPLPRGEPHETVENWHIVPTPRHKWKYYEYNFIFYRAGARLIREGKTFDVLRAHAVASTGPGLLALARRHSIPCHLHYHHWEKHLVRNLIERITLHRYDLVTTDSEWSRSGLIRRYELRNPVVVNYPGVPPDYGPGPVDRDLGARFGDKQMLLFVGALVQRKNLAFLLNVIKQLKAQGRDKLVLVIVGSGPLEETLKGQAWQMGLSSSVVFTGRVKEIEKINYYRLCRVFVFPSLVEGFGMAAAEAMAFGKPVVACNVSSIPEVVEHGVSGLLSDPADERAFLANITRLLDSPDLRADMGRAGQRRVAERFAFDRTARQLLDLYLQIRK